MVRYDLGKYQLALEDCDEVLRRAAEHVGALKLRGMVRRQLGDLAGALQDYSQAIQKNPEDPATYSLRGSVYYQQRQFGRAVQDHMDALKRDPRNAFTFNQLGWIWSTAPDPDIRNGRQARECATRACELSEWQEPGFLDTLAAAYAECGQFEEAVKYQTKARDLAATEAQADYESRLELYKDRRPYRTK
jgi:serine/threonine-protein kinase